MTTATADQGETTVVSVLDNQSLRPAEERGRISYADRVVEKLVRRAVAEVEQAGGVDRRVLGLGRGRGPETSRVSVVLDGDVATVRVTLSVVWPASVPEVTERVRDHVRERLRDLASIRVAEVDIDVAELPTDFGPGRRRVR